MYGALVVFDFTAWLNWIQLLKAQNIAEQQKAIEAMRSVPTGYQQSHGIQYANSQQPPVQASSTMYQQSQGIQYMNLPQPPAYTVFPTSK
jgi:hypothetical protein